MRFEEKVEVTPALAEKWLKLNREDNRNKKSYKITNYARDMKAGRWRLTGDTIKFDIDGRLMDGQNRLAAVVEADVAVTFSIMYDVESDVMPVIDTGAARNFSDALIVNGTPNRFNVGAIVRWVNGIERAGQWVATSGTYRPTHSELLSRYELDPLTFASAGARGGDVSKAGLGNSAAAGTAYFIFSKIDDEAAKMFFDAIISGASLVTGQPELTLRNRLTRVRYDSASRSEQLALFIRAWNAMRQGRELRTIMASSTGILTNENFPKPK